MRDLAIVIPAVKKNVAFPDDLVKKLAGMSLIQRAINTAKLAFPVQQVHVATDSEEIRLICQRNAVSCTYDKSLRLDSDNLLGSLCLHLGPMLDQRRDLLLLSPYAPLIKADELRRAYQEYLAHDKEILIPVCSERLSVFEPGPRRLNRLMHEGFGRDLISESHAFLILQTTALLRAGEYSVDPFPYLLSEPPGEIRSYQDWWLCEKIINRRRIVFRVIGSKDVGMGHIARCLALAHEIADHEIRFVCDAESEIAVSKLAGYDYWLGVYSKEDIEAAILDLMPDLVVNDMLNTEADYIRRLKKNRIRVVNFEDLGSGASEADLTINDLYDDPVIPGDNILWGREWFFVRDEFADAAPRKFRDQVRRLLIAFGGTDPSDYTLRVLRTILGYCASNDIEIDIVTGDGYANTKELVTLIAATPTPKLRHIHVTGVMSDLMEQVDIAICSNGRTVYELAHMNVPAIVLSHHERERAHDYACEANGFVPLGIAHGDAMQDQLLRTLQQLVEDTDHRRKLFDAVKTADFAKNKRHTVSRILELLDVDGGEG